MNRPQEFKGKNLEDAILHAEHKLKLPRTEFNYEIVTEKTRLFGISKEVVIRAWPKSGRRRQRHRGLPGKADQGLPPGAHLPRSSGATASCSSSSTAPTSSSCSGRTDRSSWPSSTSSTRSPTEKVQVDCEFFRKRKEKKIRDYAQQVAQHVRQTGRNEILELMNPYERRIVHIAVNQVPGITSESLGDGFLKTGQDLPRRPAGQTGPAQGRGRRDLSPAAPAKPEPFTIRGGFYTIFP